MLQLDVGTEIDGKSLVERLHSLGFTHDATLKHMCADEEMRMRIIDIRAANFITLKLREWSPSSPLAPSQFAAF